MAPKFAILSTVIGVFDDSYRVQKVGSEMIKFGARLVILALLASCSADVAVDVITSSDEAKLGDPENILFWNFEEKVAGFRNIDKFGQVRAVPAGDSPYPLPRVESNLDAIEFEYDGESWTLDKFIETQKVAGLIVVKDGSIILERYSLGNTAESRWISFSITKAVTSLLVGAALRDGYIEGLDNKITSYVTTLKNSSYDDSSIKNVMQMASGVQWSEINSYADPEADINKVPWRTLEMYRYLRQKPRMAAPGQVFNYNTAETNLVGDVVRSAIGNNLSTYLSEKIWKPFGMEHDAYWVLVEPGGGEFGGSSLCATLRDYARLGLFALHNGVLADGRKILPEGWMDDSTGPSATHEGYGYMWWLQGEGAYAASGIFGQRIHIDPVNNIVIAMHSARDDANNSDDWKLMTATFAALINEAKQ